MEEPLAYGQHGNALRQGHWAVACWLPRGSWAVSLGRKQRRLLVDALSSRSIMSTAPASTAQPNFASIFNAALESYKRKTKKDLASHPLLPSFETCDSPEAVLTVLRDEVPAFGQSQNRDDRLTKWVTPTVNVLCSFSGTIGAGIGLVNIRHEESRITSSNVHLQAFPPANVIFAGIGVLLSVGFLRLSLCDLF